MSRTISIKGTGKISVKVDCVQIQVIVEGKNKEYKKAVSEAADLVAKLDKNLEQAGFEKNDLKTESYGVQKDFKYTTNRKGISERKENGFICRHILKLEFDFDNKKLTDTISAVTNCISEAKMDILFTVKDKNDVNKQLLSSVAENAKSKAEVLCASAGGKLGKLISIDYNWEERDLYSRSKLASRKLDDTAILGNMIQALPPQQAISEPLDIRPEDITVTDSAMFVWEIE